MTVLSPAAQVWGRPHPATALLAAVLGNAGRTARKGGCSRSKTVPFLPLKTVPLIPRLPRLFAKTPPFRLRSAGSAVRHRLVQADQPRDGAFARQPLTPQPSTRTIAPYQTLPPSRPPQNIVDSAFPEVTRLLDCGTFLKHDGPHHLGLY